jgi:hypothetical protein
METGELYFRTYCSLEDLDESARPLAVEKTFFASLATYLIYFRSLVEVSSGSLGGADAMQVVESETPLNIQNEKDARKVRAAFLSHATRNLSLRSWLTVE